MVGLYEKMKCSCVGWLKSTVYGSSYCWRVCWITEVFYTPLRAIIFLAQLCDRTRWYGLIRDSGDR